MTNKPWNVLPIITQLSGTQERRPGGHNWPDMEIVIEPNQTDIEDGALYLIDTEFWSSPCVKKCVDNGTCIRLSPALATVHGIEKPVSLFGKTIPCVSIEFTDSIYKHRLKVCGKMIGLWGGR